MTTRSGSYPARRKPYRIIYQADTSWGIQNSRDAADYLLGMVGFLETTHVDALFWHNGFDIAAWVREELVDMIILGTGAIDIEVEAFKQLTIARTFHKPSTTKCVMSGPGRPNEPIESLEYLQGCEGRPYYLRRGGVLR